MQLLSALVEIQTGASLDVPQYFRPESVSPLCKLARVLVDRSKN